MKHVHSSQSSGVSRRDSLFRIQQIICLLFCLTLSFALFNTLPSEGASVPTGFAETKIVGSLWTPTAMVLLPDGRIFFCEQGGSVRVIKNGALLSAPFVTVTVNASGERGLIGITIDPNFTSNGYVYIYYTATSPNIHNRVSRFTASGDVASGGETVLFDLNPLSSATNHNGGALHFGNDGKLYIAVGDNATGSNSQTLGNLLGKILRINSNGSIPTDNPFYSSASGNNRAIWALGLRNPFTFASQPGTSRKFINDVGASTYEEINDGIAGSNYGWPATEGPTPNPSYRAPIHSYGHGSTSTTGCAITGGTFYNPQTVQFPTSYVGDYFFADYCTGWIRKLDPSNNSTSSFASGISGPVDLQVSSTGRLYYLARGTGSNTGVLYRIDYTASQAPSISSQPSNITVSVGQSASFSVTASGTPPLSYQWQRNSSNISGATSSTYTLNSTTLSDNGALFRCVVTNSFGTATSNQATLTVVSNSPPTANITQPVSGTKYNGGSVINYSGTGSDPQDGTLGGSAFTWRVDFHHDAHIHPFIPDTTGSTGGSFTVPTTGHTESTVWYRIHLTVSDSGGLTTSVSRDVTPNTVNITLATNPSGLQLKLDAQPVTSPYTVTGVVGILRNLEAVSPQTVGATTYQFVSWSDGGARIHDVSTPSTNTTYTATFQVGSGGGNGNGLAATYYDNKDLTGATYTRVDPIINFNWGNGSPAPGIGADTFSVRWTGFVQPLYTQAYTFYTRSDDGVRLWVNNQQIINNWTDHSLTENASSSVSLQAGQQYAITMEFYDSSLSAVAELLWSSSSQSKLHIPTSQLFSQGGGGGGGGGGTWQNQDIGSVGVAGTTTIAGGTYTVDGSGSDIWNGSDSFQYAYQTLAGDGEIIARVASVENTNSWAKAGVMIRESLVSNSKHAFMLMSATSGLLFQYRTNTGGSSVGVAGGSGTAPYWVRLVRSGNTFTGYKSTNGTSWTLVSSVNITMANSVYLGLAVTSHNNGVLCTAVFDSVSVPGGGGPPGSLPSPWQKADIGSVGVTGTAGYSSGTFTVDGSGQDIWNSADGFHFVYQSLAGDGQIVARVNSLENTDPWAKAGVMIRESLASNSKHAFMLITPSNGISFQSRTATGGSSSITAGGSVAVPYWLKVVRSGSTFTGYKSTDGISWTQVGSNTTISMGTSVYVGLAVTSHNNSTLCTSTFSSVSP